MVKTIYILQPVANRDISEINQERHKVMEACKLVYGDNVAFVYTKIKLNNDVKGLLLLSERIKDVNDADVLVLVRGWSNDPAARTLARVASEYGIFAWNMEIPNVSIGLS